MASLAGLLAAPAEQCHPSVPHVHALVGGRAVGEPRIGPTGTQSRITRQNSGFYRDKGEPKALPRLAENHACLFVDVPYGFHSSPPFMYFY